MAWFRGWLKGYTRFRILSNIKEVTRKITFFSIIISIIPEAAGSAFSFQCNFQLNRHDSEQSKKQGR
jgi:hypothetical protein